MVDMADRVDSRNMIKDVIDRVDIVNGGYSE